MTKTKLEILKETYDYYTADSKRRSYRIVNGRGRCEYFNPLGEMCAVGRCLIPDSYKKIEQAYGNKPITSFDENLDTLLKTEYRGHDSNFWVDLQRFHDSDLNWFKDGITVCGQGLYDQLTVKYS